MTEPEPEICGATVEAVPGLVCDLPVGVNAHNDERDEDVHVHHGVTDAGDFNWEG